MWFALRVNGTHLSQLSFTQTVISFSTWQTEQKKVGKEDVCICCTVSQTYGVEKGNCCVTVFHAGSTCYTLTLMGSQCKKEGGKKSNNAILCCFIAPYDNGFVNSVHEMKGTMWKEEMCERKTDREKTERPGQCHAGPGPSIREIAATNCRLHSLKAETPVWSAGLCHTPDTRLCDVSLWFCMCFCRVHSTFSYSGISFSFFSFFFFSVAKGSCSLCPGLVWLWSSWSHSW